MLKNCLNEFLTLFGFFFQAVHEKPLINDPAIIMYSANSRHLPPNVFATGSNMKDNSPLHSTVNVHTGNKTSHKHAKPSLATESTGEVTYDYIGTSLSDYICLPQSPGKPRRCVRDTHLQHSTLEEPSAPAGLDHAQATKKPVHPKPPEDIIDQLRTIFPHYTRYFSMGKMVVLKALNFLCFSELKICTFMFPLQSKAQWVGCERTVWVASLGLTSSLGYQ